MHRSEDTTKRAGGLMMLLTWVSILILLVFIFSEYLKKQHNPNTQLESGQVNEKNTIILQRNRYDHYVASGEINHQPVTFILDTGATIVSVPEHIAEKLNLKKQRESIVNTANGRVIVYNTTLDHIRLGDIKMHGIPAAINPHMTDDAILLGMSFLKHLHFSQSKDKLLLEQY